MTKNKYYQFLLATYCKNTFRTKIYYFLFYFYQKIKIISVYFEFIAIYPCLGIFSYCLKTALSYIFLSGPMFNYFGFCPCL